MATADGGIDGRIYFGSANPNIKNLQSTIVQVKDGKNVGISDLRELLGVLETDEAQLAGLIVLEPLGSRKGQSFRRFIAEAGDLEGKSTPTPFTCKEHCLGASACKTAGCLA